VTAKRQWRDLHGIVLLDKPEGLSSNQALQRVRRVFQARKAGHAGSLDPFATGMLPICFGRATRVNAFLLESSKRYQVTARLGQATATGDTEGLVTESGDVPTLTMSQVELACQQWTGQIEQVPPMYSALKHKGRRLYELAREGIVVERPARTVTIHQITLQSIGVNTLELEVHCSKGTYIRTLVEDMAATLGCLAHTQALRRLEVEPFDPQAMITLEQFESQADNDAQLLKLLMPADQGLVHLQAMTVDTEDLVRLCHGKTLERRDTAAAGMYRLYGPGDEFLAIVDHHPDRTLKVQKVLCDIESLLAQYLTPRP